MTQVNAMSFALPHSNLLRAHATAIEFDPHLHSTYSIVALRKGVAEIRSARWSGIARAGDVFFFNPYEVHSASCSEENAEYETLYPSKDFLIGCLDHERLDEPLHFQTAILGTSSATVEFIDTLFTPVIEGNSIEAALRQIVARCDFSTDAVQSPEPLARRACLLIHKNCTRAMRTEELARELGVHRSHLIRTFSNAVGMAPQTYLRQVRVAKARELICEGSDLSEVAFMLDFSDQAHLTREFKKVFGVPPGALSRDIGRRRKEGSSRQQPLS
ncbi:helix-turn-helix domain-containing protein [Deinococcus aquatilis]|uniref:helix-turn-helix domain-containing protein n=1 Tax=Deinococcus aquatilis TaxID=519440 RepID=UPI00036E213E|nr:AraC family transcriptional regulator [Deinococcus aquatilis]